MPIGTDLLNFGGSYTVDEQLNISMVPAPPQKSITVVSLPARLEALSIPSTVQMQGAQHTIQLEQAIRNLQTR